MRKTKISRIGNSAGVILPQHVLNELGLKTGTTVEISIDQEHHGVLIRRPPQRKRVPVDARFAARVEDFIRRYKPALDELAR